jgi:hypothetical protein
VIALEQGHGEFGVVTEHRGVTLGERIGHEGPLELIGVPRDDASRRAAPTWDRGLSTTG